MFILCLNGLKTAFELRFRLFFTDWNVIYDRDVILGIWEKQSSFYFMAKSCLNTIVNNVVFNLPRAVR